MAGPDEIWHSLAPIDPSFDDDQTPPINTCTDIVLYVPPQEADDPIPLAERAVADSHCPDVAEKKEKKKRPIAFRSFGPSKKQATGVKHNPLNAGTSSFTSPCTVRKSPVQTRNDVDVPKKPFVPDVVKPVSSPGTGLKSKQQTRVNVQTAASSTSEDRQRVLDALKTFEKLHNTESARSFVAAKQMRLQGQWVGRGVYYFGHVPGIRVGDVFRYRAELCIVNLHNQSQGGIAWVKGEYNKWGVPVSNSIVLSEGYYANRDDGDSFVYVGSGDFSKDQQLARGNLALANSCRLKVPVRVIRAMDKTLRYDGLYCVTSFWDETNERGNLVYKFRMEPCNGTLPSGESSANLKRLRKLRDCS